MTAALITTLITLGTGFALVSLADSAMRGVRAYRNLKGIS